MTVRMVLAVGLIGLGTFTVCVAALGLFRFRDVLERVHAGALADTLGLLLVVAGLCVLCGWTVHTAKLVLVLGVLWVTNPVSSHLIVRMELLTGRGVDPDSLEGEGEREL